ncbi:dihydroorotate dehydrogenase electron transfer subunit [candidate division TA06 bacterium]|uniref:Dihydroorotate dehydrogenase B (NAD(+)), electron transfer subunit n=1 Tax=candidate division TA06 bacterium TaxID=2250710 RepID=A0A933MLB8_UNCT6|nr:dihydroorotate dehydrogenase electron transfer subunit [candidate division TA06 bacterium]
MLEQKVNIVSHQKIAPDVFLLSFRSDYLAAKARPGQFVHLKPSGPWPLLLRRPFSINRIKGKNIFIMYRVAGRGTSILSSLPQGAELDVMGPLGNGFEIDKKYSDHLILAGGIGLAPMQFLADRLKTMKLNARLFYGCSGKKDLLPCAVPGKVIATDDGSCGYKGFVTDAFLSRINKFRTPVVYACGPWPMLKKTARICRENKIDCQVSLEAFMACGVGACQGCVVKGVKEYLTVCRQGPVFNSREIDWEQEATL